MSDDQEPLSPRVRAAIAAEKAVRSPSLPPHLLRRVQGSLQEASSPRAATATGGTLAGWRGVALGAVLGGAGGFWIRGALTPPVERTIRVEVPTVVEKRVEVPVIVEKRIEVPVPTPRSTIIPVTKPVPEEASPPVAVQPNRDEQLAKERLVLDRARSAILSSKFDDALSAIREHEKTFEAPLLAEEREYLAIRALASAHDIEGATTRLEQFERRWPSSVFLTRLKEIVLP